MHVYARGGLVQAYPPHDEPALLLEGSWPAHEPWRARWSLDDCIDARHEWIDVAAQHLAEQAGPSPHAAPGPALAWWHALGLRYYLVRLLRPICFFQDIAPDAAGKEMQLIAEAGRDEDYAHVLAALAEQAGGTLRVTWHAPLSNPPHRRAPRLRPPSLRAWLGRVAARRVPPRAADPDAPRLLICGSPAVFDSLCPALLAQGAAVWWLHERFPFRCWWRWRRSGMVHLACMGTSDAGSGSGAGAGPFCQAQRVGRLVCRGIDLGPPVERWLQARAWQYGSQHRQLLSSVWRHLPRVRPHLVVLDEDATPFKRVVVACAARLGVPTAVVQHGAECVRFGFVPLAADFFLAWAPAARQQLIRWGAPPERVLLAEGPLHQRAAALPRWPGLPSRGRPRILLLATVPPQEQRPDSVALHLTPRTFQDMWQALCTALKRCAPDCTLLIKPHPRTRDLSALRSLCSSTHLRVRWTRQHDLGCALSGCQLVVSMYSTAGLEAAAAGWPVIQLLPAGSKDILPPAPWGLLGSARHAGELETLLRGVLEGTLRPQPSPLAASRLPPLAESLLQLASSRQTEAEAMVCA